MLGLNPLIVDKINEANGFYKEGNIIEAIEKFISILNEINKSSEALYQSVEARLIVMSLYRIYYSQKNFQQAKKWAKEAFKFDVPARATTELINLGAVHLNLGEYDEAYDCFLKAYEKGKYRAFKEENEEYWDFFKSRKK